MHFAAQGVMAGAYDIVVAAGVEVMTRTPMGSTLVDGMGYPFPPKMQDRYRESGLPAQGIGAEMIADEFGLTREALDAYGARSQQRALAATREGRFENEIPSGGSGNSSGPNSAQMNFVHLAACDAAKCTEIDRVTSGFFMRVMSYVRRGSRGRGAEVTA